MDKANIVAFPDGTASHPFNLASDALLFCNLADLSNCIINVTGTFTSFYLTDLKIPITIDFNNCSINDLSIIRCANVVLVGTASIKTLTVLNCLVFGNSTSLSFVGSGASGEVAIYANRGGVIGSFGSVTSYTGAIRSLASVVNVRISPLTDVDNTVYASNNSIIYVNGSAAES